MAKKSIKLYLILEPLDLNMSCVRCGRPRAPGRAARTILAVRYIASAQLNALTNCRCLLYPAYWGFQRLDGAK